MSKTYQDTFTRTAGNLAGSTSSDGLFTWTVPDGSDPGTNGTAVATGFGHPVFTALTSADCDSDAMYAEVDYDPGSGGNATLWIDVSSNSIYGGAGGNGYEFAAYGGNAYILAYANGAFTTLTSAAHTISTGTYRVERNGSTLTFKKDGVTIVTTTDSSEGTGVGNRRAAFGCDSSGQTSNIQTFNEFRYGDIATGLTFNPTGGSLALTGATPTLTIFQQKSFVGSFTVPASGSVSVTGVGFRPTCVLFWGDRLSADGATKVAAAFPPFFGVALSSSSRLALTESDDFVSVIDTALDTTKCIKSISGSTTNFAADFTSMDSDGFTVNFSTGNGTAYVVNFLALNDPSVFIKSFTTAVAGGNQGYTGVGFKPGAALFIGQSSALKSWTIGMAVSSSQRGVSQFNYDGGTVAGVYQRTTKCYAALNVSTVQNEADFVSFDTDGFTLNWGTVNAATHTVYALCLNGGQYAVGNFTQKLSAGSQGYTGVGFNPTGLFLLSVGRTANTAFDGTNGLAIMIGMGSNASHRAVMQYQSGTNVVGDLDRAAIYARYADDSTPSLLSKADLTTLDSDGFTLNYSQSDATAREVIYFAFGPAGPAALTFNPSGGSLLLAGKSAIMGMGALPVNQTLGLVGASPLVVIPGPAISQSDYSQFPKFRAQSGMRDRQ